MDIDHSSALNSTCLPRHFSRSRPLGDVTCRLTSKVEGHISKPLAHRGRKVISTSLSLSQYTDKGKCIAIELSLPVAKRERSLVPAPWERIRRGTYQISSNDEDDDEVPFALAPGASDSAPNSAKEVLLVMSNGSTFFGAPSRFRNLIGGLLNSRLKAYCNFASFMLAELKSTEDKRANLETLLVESQGKFTFMEEG
ncbi:hypothetical protein LWI28_013839 [Acer negundo]|uniref:Uncharacterized protein n=1 Tax=Acer negundo TaxID=4023 RepID=A0AAD5P0F3_ACENE|nr:hypothetical protein LWI28_013839 [Acer negundo]